MLEFLAGMICGAILGVIADRLWDRFEARPRFNICFGYSETAYGKTTGYFFDITNAGSRPTPGYEIALFHPGRGTSFHFMNETPGVLEPDQTDHHESVVFNAGRPADLKRWIFHEQDKPVTDVQFDGFLFRLVMRKSDKILFESATIGNMLAELYVRSFQTGRTMGPTWEENQRLNASPRRSPIRWGRDLMTRRPLNSLFSFLPSFKR